MIEPDTFEISESGMAPLAAGEGRSILVSIVIPVYNEFRSLPEVLKRVLAAPLPDGCDREVIVVDDGSTDGTTGLLRTYASSPKVRIHESVLNFGKGAAVRVGIAKAEGDIIIVQDGDLEYDPRDYHKIITPLVTGEAQVVYGSRFRGQLQNMHWLNLTANKILTFTANLLYGAGITDEATAYKAFRSDVLKRIKLNCLKFEFCPEVTGKLRRCGVPIHEVGIRYNARNIAEGKKIRASDGFQALWTLIRYRLASKRSFMKRRSMPAVQDPPRQPA